MKAFRTRMPERSGFTLIELLIVIAIILILIAIALPSFLEAQVRAKVVRVQADLRTIATANEMYLQDFNQYPPQSEDEFSVGRRGLAQLTSPLNYLQELPFDAFVGGGAPEDGRGNYFEMASTGPDLIRARLGMRPYKNINAFAVYSPGPCLMQGRDCDPFEDEGDWPFGGPAHPCPDPNVKPNCGTSSYSPTNGTKSFGGLNQFGGEWRSGHWCLDWQLIRGAGWERL